MCRNDHNHRCTASRVTQNGSAPRILSAVQCMFLSLYVLNVAEPYLDTFSTRVLASAQWGVFFYNHPSSSLSHKRWYQYASSTVDWRHTHHHCMFRGRQSWPAPCLVPRLLCSRCCSPTEQRFRRTFPPWRAVVWRAHSSQTFCATNGHFRQHETR